jgi:hypothetical protein
VFTVRAIPVARVGLTPSRAAIAVGKTIQLTATALDLAGSVISGRVVNWTVSNSLIAGISSSGIAVGLNPGVVMASATIDGVVASVPLVVFVPATSGHIIGVRIVNGSGEFYDRFTGAPFTPRGSNYIRLDSAAKIYGGKTFYHSTFNVGLYDAARAEAALTRMQSLGFNTVRIFVQGGTAGSIAGSPSGLSAEYVANFVDFLRRAKTHNIVVLLCGSDYLPDSPPYSAILATENGPLFQDQNLELLSKAGLAAAQQFWVDFIQLLSSQHAALDDILGFELMNEYSFPSNLPPFSLSSGSITTGNGRTYDISDPAARQRMMEENLTNYVTQLRTTIVNADPTALVTIGEFWPQSPNPSRAGDPRIALPIQPLLSSTADFLDLHPYSYSGLTMAQMAANFAIPPVVAKPLLMGEFGADHTRLMTAQSAITNLVNWQKASCLYNFKGWLHWTWDTVEQTNPSWWMATEGGVGEALSATARPGPCAS